MAANDISVEVIQNRKGEKILKVSGFKDKMTNDQYGDEVGDRDEEDEEQTLFVNLNRLCKDQKNQHNERGSIPQ